MENSALHWWFPPLPDYGHPNLRKIEKFPIGIGDMLSSAKTMLARLAARLMISFRQNSQRKESIYQTTGRLVRERIRPKPAKPIVDEISRVLTKPQGFTEEEPDFISYDIKYRMRR